MDFSWTNQQTELYEMALKFARTELTSVLAPDSNTFSTKAWQRCGEFGLLGLSVPEQYGGLGLNALTTARVIEAMGRGCHDMGLLFSATAHLFACVMPILESGHEQLKNDVLPKLSTGQWIGANAITEAEAGSDVFALKTRCVQDGDHYIINGSKSYVTNAPIAEIFLVYATSNPAHGFLGVSAFVVKKNTAGLVIGKPFKKIGLTSSPISSIYLENVRVPSSFRLGADGQGAAVFTKSMQWERACLFAAYLGLMARQLEQVIAYAKERRQSGKAIGKYQAISHRIAEMRLRLDAAKLLLYRACWLMDQGEDATVEVCLSKLAVSEAAIQSSMDSIQIHGGNGVVTEMGVERALRDCIPSTIFSGTSEIQKNLIARGLGL
jgi:alkylation response protein AidB-like acyl-CoA dehydrogenase